MDRHTRFAYYFLQNMGSTRDLPDPNGTDVRVPVDNRLLPSKYIMKGITIPTYDEVCVRLRVCACG